jgi:choline-sulfatase
VKRHYAGLISLIDHWIGEMMRILTAREFDGNTIIIFLSDHGEMMGDHGLFQKSIMYEAALRVPLVISDPRHNRSGVDESLVELVDIYPTLLDMAGADFDPQPLDGKSMSDLISGTSGSRHKEFQISQLANTRMIFDGRFKFIENYNDLNELYDLKTDPNELENIVAKDRAKVKELLQVLRETTK